MKQYLLNTAIAVFMVVALSIPQKGIGQCLCENGVTPDSIIHTFTLNPTSNFVSPITFARFDPAVGTLNCLTLTANITAVNNLGIRNLDSLPRDYEFLYTQAITISGPGGLNANATATKNYGPTSLDQYGGPVDSTHFGPDTPFVNRSLVRNSTNVAPYLGTGNVTINFTNTGSTLLLQGSNNYRSTVTTFAWGEFRLAYYWCQSAMLAANIRSFSAVRMNDKITLSWQVENEEAANTYELQMSYNGKQFKPVKKFAAGNSPQGAAAYEYLYLPEQAVSGKIYFRVKQVNATGKTTYSVVRFVEADQTSAPGKVTLYPNPVKGQVSMQFGKALTGNYKVQLVNLTGQTIYERIFKMNNTNSILFEIPGTPAGIYYLRASNTQGNETYTSKLTVQQ